MRMRPAFLGGRASQRAAITLGGVSLPPKNETLHTLLVGSTGVGKTTLIDEVLAGIVSRGDRAIVVDPGAHHLTHFGGDDDIILNPFDRRGQGWTIFNEIRKDFDYFRLAKSHHSRWSRPRRELAFLFANPRCRGQLRRSTVRRYWHHQWRRLTH